MTTPKRVGVGSLERRKFSRPVKNEHPSVNYDAVTEGPAHKDGQKTNKKRILIAQHLSSVAIYACPLREDEQKKRRGVWKVLEESFGSVMLRYGPGQPMNGQSAKMLLRNNFQKLGYASSVVPNYISPQEQDSTLHMWYFVSNGPNSSAQLEDGKKKNMEADSSAQLEDGKKANQLEVDFPKRQYCSSKKPYYSAEREDNIKKTRFQTPRRCSAVLPHYYAQLEQSDEDDSADDDPILMDDKDPEWTPYPRRGRLIIRFKKTDPELQTYKITLNTAVNQARAEAKKLAKKKYLKMKYENKKAALNDRRKFAKAE